VDQLPAFVYVVPLKPGSRATYISSHIETLTGVKSHKVVYLNLNKSLKKSYHITAEQK